MVLLNHRHNGRSTVSIASTVSVASTVSIASIASIVSIVSTPSTSIRSPPRHPHKSRPPALTTAPAVQMLTG